MTQVIKFADHFTGRRLVEAQFNFFSPPSIDDLIARERRVFAELEKNDGPRRGNDSEYAYLARSAHFFYDRCADAGTPMETIISAVIASKSESLASRILNRIVSAAAVTA